MIHSKNSLNARHPPTPRSTHRARTGLLASIFLCLLAHLSAALACAPISKDDTHIGITDEEALIVWDEAAKTEHFIRRGLFKTVAKDFGFLVPTPTQPELHEADGLVFKDLAKITAPAIKECPQQAGYAGAPAPAAAPAAAAAKVTVVSKQKVAGLDATVLSATDPRALADWLRSHAYPSNPDIEKWLVPYIAKGWMITAFKFDSDPVRREFKSPAVRMSFRTEQPFYPYREPESQRRKETTASSGGWPSRSLRVFLLASNRVEGAFEGDSAKAAWPGALVWSREITPAERDKIADRLKLDLAKLFSANRLTEFEDKSSPRPGTDDVIFRKAADQGTVLREPVCTWDLDRRFRDTPERHDARIIDIGYMLRALGAWLGAFGFFFLLRMIVATSFPEFQQKHSLLIGTAAANRKWMVRFMVSAFLLVMLGQCS